MKSLSCSSYPFPERPSSAAGVTRTRDNNCPRFASSTSENPNSKHLSCPSPPPLHQGHLTSCRVRNELSGEHRKRSRASRAGPLGTRLSGTRLHAAGLWGSSLSSVVRDHVLRSQVPGRAVPTLGLGARPLMTKDGNSYMQARRTAPDSPRPSPGGGAALACAAHRTSRRETGLCLLFVTWPWKQRPLSRPADQPEPKFIEGA